METFEGENMEAQYSVLNYGVDLYFYDYELAIEIDERRHKDVDEYYEKQREKLVKKIVKLCIYQN